MAKLLVVVVLAAVSAASAWSASTGRQYLVFDALTVQAAQSGPRDYKPGHIDSSNGTLSDAAGHAVGSFSVTCVVVKMLSGTVAQQRCTGSVTTADGKVAFAGFVPTNVKIPSVSLGNGAGAYRGAQGTVSEYMLSQKESLVFVEVSARSVLRAGKVAHPTANTAFRSRVGNVCAVAARRLASVHLFPFAVFASQRPSAQRLPKLAKYLLSADARPVLRSLDNGLAALGRPPADGDVWARLLADRKAVLAAQDAIDRAAQAANVDAFSKGVHQGVAAVHDAAVDALVFGAPGCVL